MPIATTRFVDSPLVTILDADFDRLEALADAGESSGHPAAEFLAAELERAVVRPADEVGPNIVRMNSRVAFRIDGRRDVQVRTLVYPEEYARRADRERCVSVMTPLGAALLGLRVGSGMAYATATGGEQYVSVVGLLQADADDDAAAAGADAAAPRADGRHDAKRTASRRSDPNGNGDGPAAA